jgi:hypothetical protein
LQYCRPVLTDALQGLRRRSGIWRYMTLTRRVYGVPFLSRPTDVPCVPIRLIHTMAFKKSAAQPDGMHFHSH